MSLADEKPEDEIGTYHVQQYELHVSTYEVEAHSIAWAIRRVLDGDGNLSNRHRNCAASLTIAGCALKKVATLRTRFGNSARQ